MRNTGTKMLALINRRPGLPEIRLIDSVQSEAVLKWVERGYGEHVPTDEEIATLLSRKTWP